MYRHCIYCSANLGRNETFEAFPVGQSLAFDSWKGRLWAVCPRCARWNLAPIEERWETLEEAERVFRDARRRVQSENVGLARLRDGSQLIRIGEALPGELAAWRYGRELRRRRSLHIRQIAMAAAFGEIGFVALFLHQSMQRRAVLHRVMPGSADGSEVTGADTTLYIQGRHLAGARIVGGESTDELRIELPQTALRRSGLQRTRFSRGPAVTIEGAEARALLTRALVQVNHQGAPRRKLNQAVSLLERAGTAEACLAQLGGAAGADRAVLGVRSRFGRLVVEPESVDRRGGWAAGPARGVTALALEMALHEEAERQAMEEELTALEAAWREAEEIAQIADSLLPVPLPRRAGVPLTLALALALGTTIACADADRTDTGGVEQPERASAASNATTSDQSRQGDVPSCLNSSGPQLTGESAGLVRIGATESSVRAECNVVADTALTLEGQAQPAILVEVGTDTVLAEIVRDRVWRIRVTSPGLRTADSVGVGTPARRLLAAPGANVVWGEGNHVIVSPEYPGLSFLLTGLPPRARPWRTEEVAEMPDSVRVGGVMVLGIH